MFKYNILPINICLANIYIYINNKNFKWFKFEYVIIYNIYLDFNI